MGSTISNILGAFSLGLLFRSGPVQFDRTAKVYTGFLFLITTVVVALSYLGWLNRVSGGILIAIFVAYIASIGYAIYRGVSIPLDESDSDSDSDISDEDHHHDNLAATSETSPLLNNSQPTTVTGEPATWTRRRRSLVYHVVQLILGFASLSISGYILSHSASSIADSLSLSGTVVGITILSFATTLPEKLVAVLSGSRGHGGIMIASTAGSNIFLLTLCMGVIVVTGVPEDHVDDRFAVFELAVTWVSSALLFLIVMLGLGRPAGVVLIAAYVAFLVLEFTVYRR
jgi:Ca2+/Na+ antiporter